jgi:tetratricopeptide (TPR) repeat protein
VALHTRFSSRGVRVLSRTRARDLGGGVRPVTLAAATLAGAAALVPLLVGPPRVVNALRSASGPDALARADQVVRRWPGDPEALAVRSQLRAAAAQRVWEAGTTPDGRVLATWAERRPAALALLSGAETDVRRALALTPTDPMLFERLAWVYVAEGAVAPDRRGERRRQALAAMEAAVRLAPRNPYLHRSHAMLAAQAPAPLVDVALAAGRRAVELDPRLVPDLVGRLLPLALTGAGWLALVPERAADRLELGAALERNGLDREAADVYRAAAELPGAGTAVVARWLAARAFSRAGDTRAAISEAERAVAQEPDNPEVHRVLARALAAAGDARALEAYQRAVTMAVAESQRAVAPTLFAATDPRVRELIRLTLAAETETGPVRHRRALGRYLLERRLWDPARRAWEEIIDERPGDAEAHFSRGLSLAGQGARGEAIEAYRRAVALDGRSVRYRLSLAELLWVTEQYHQAIKEWQTVVMRAPGNLEARLGLAAAYMHIGARADAVREYRQVLEIAPDNPVARRALGRS